MISYLKNYVNRFFIEKQNIYKEFYKSIAKIALAW